MQAQWFKSAFAALASLFVFAAPIDLSGNDGHFVLSAEEYRVPDSLELRKYQDVILDCGKDGKACFTVSLPENIPPEGLSCSLIVGGLKTGRESLQFIPDHGNCALIAYEYPDALKKLYEIDVVWNFYAVRKAMLAVPSQLIHILKYLNNRPWNTQMISLMGYSFGATFVPVTYVKAKEEKVNLGPGVLCYGGAGIYCLSKANILVPKFLKGPISLIVAAAFKSIDPILHAPKMKGEFLILNGTYDSKIPEKCAQNLQHLIPEPKTVMNLETEHMHPSNVELNLKLIHICRKWLEDTCKN